MLQSKSLVPTFECCFDDYAAVSRFMDAHDEGDGCFIVKMPFMTHNGGRKFCDSKGKKLHARFIIML